MNKKNLIHESKQRITAIDLEYSRRFIALDPNGYFIIKLSYADQEIIVEHYTNNIDQDGIATDPETGKPLLCNANLKRSPIGLYKGKTAKEVAIQLSEKPERKLISLIDHAMYIGRELQKAEYCLIHQIPYIQD